MKKRLFTIFLTLFAFIYLGYISVGLAENKTQQKIPEQKVSKNSTLSQKKQDFVAFIKPHVQVVNDKISQDRAKLLDLNQKHIKQKPISTADYLWVSKLAKYYRIKNFKKHLSSQWLELIKRVDIVPVPLALAQAACESGWGSSRFAKEANNFFGQWCFTAECGIVPKNRDSGANHEVKRFESPYDSVAAYVRNLNSNRAYKNLRAIRAQSREQGKLASGAVLASGLLHYSSRGQLYVEQIQNMIKVNQFN